jgi:hypothetical protein
MAGLRLGVGGMSHRHKICLGRGQIGAGVPQKVFEARQYILDCQCFMGRLCEMFQSARDAAVAAQLERSDRILPVREIGSYGGADMFGRAKFGGVHV